MSILIKNVSIIDSKSTYHGQTKDVLIEKGIILSIGKIDTAKKIIEGKGLCISPGWVDLNTFVGEPGLEFKENITSSLKAAAAGGFTTVACNSNVKPVIDTKESIAYLRQVSSNSLVDLKTIPAVTKGNKGTALTEMLDLNSEGATVFGDGDLPIWHTGILLKALQYVQKFNGVVFTKCFDKYLSKDGLVNESITSTQFGLKGIPYVAETIAIKKALDILKYVGGRLHISCISTKESVDLIKKAKKKGLDVTCDIAAHYLVFDDKTIAELDTNYKVFPPFRDKKDVKSLIKGIESGIIDCIISDHRPHEEDAKKLEFNFAEFGISSLETTFSSIIQSGVDLNKAIEALTYGNSQVLNASVKTIKEGESADLTVFNPMTQWTLNSMKSKSKNSPYFGQDLTGKVIAVIKASKVEQF